MAQEKCPPGKHWYRFKGMSSVPGSRELGTRRKEIQKCRVCGNIRLV